MFEKCTNHYILNQMVKIALVNLDHDSHFGHSQVVYAVCKFNIVIFARQSAHSIRMCNCVLWKKGIELYFTMWWRWHVYVATQNLPNFYSLIANNCLQQCCDSGHAFTLVFFFFLQFIWHHNGCYRMQILFFLGLIVT